MAALGDVSSTVPMEPAESSLPIVIPAWPDVGWAVPQPSSTPPPAGGGIPGAILFN